MLPKLLETLLKENCSNENYFEEWPVDGLFYITFFASERKDECMLWIMEVLSRYISKEKREIKRPENITEFKALNNGRRFYDNASLALSEVKETDFNSLPWIT